MCSCLGALAVEVGIGIADSDLFEGKIRRSGVGDVAAGTFRHSRVEDTVRAWTLNSTPGQNLSDQYRCRSQSVVELE